jgi:hypothetical protein
MTGDSWGVQEALIDGKLSLTEGWPLWWHAGQLLRAYLPDDDRAVLVDQIRQEIMAARLLDEDRGGRLAE